MSILRRISEISLLFRTANSNLQKNSKLRKYLFGGKAVLKEFHLQFIAALYCSYMHSIRLAHLSVHTVQYSTVCRGVDLVLSHGNRGEFL